MAEPTGIEELDKAYELLSTVVAAYELLIETYVSSIEDGKVTAKIVDGMMGEDIDEARRFLDSQDIDIELKVRDPDTA